jgi:hypothetical protein
MSPESERSLFDFLCCEIVLLLIREILTQSRETRQWTAWFLNLNRVDSMMR